MIRITLHERELTLLAQGRTITVTQGGRSAQVVLASDIDTRGVIRVLLDRVGDDPPQAREFLPRRNNRK